jgi:general secretion pathway protein I
VSVRDSGYGIRDSWASAVVSSGRPAGGASSCRQAARASSNPESRIPNPGLQSGYTLIEVIAAFAVLALALTLLLGSLSGASRQVRQADEASRAALHAQSLLDQVGIGEALQPGRRDGEFEAGRFQWALDIAPYIEAAPASQPQTPQGLGEPELMQLSLVVRWGEDERRQQLRLRSLRLVAPDALGGAVVP